VACALTGNISGEATNPLGNILREAMRTMLVLDDEKLCAMLHKKERGEDPSDLLFDWADDFLLKLPR